MSPGASASFFEDGEEGPVMELAYELNRLGVEKRVVDSEVEILGKWLELDYSSE